MDSSHSHPRWASRESLHRRARPRRAQGSTISAYSAARSVDMGLARPLVSCWYKGRVHGGLSDLVLTVPRANILLCSSLK